jgi:hypothetical protein
MIHSSPYLLDIWSIAPSDLLSNKLTPLGSDSVAMWRQDAVLIDRDVSVLAQGMYPVSTIIDVTANTQTIYLQAGLEYPARSGIFELTRTLNTDKLSTFITQYRNYLATTLF